MSTGAGNIEFFDATRCWLCGGFYRGEERVCFKCGSTRVLSHQSERLETNATELIALTKETEAINLALDASAADSAGGLRLRLPTIFSADSSNVLATFAHGILGGFIGGSLWCVIALLTRADVGFLAIAAGFFTGQGIGMSTPYRRATLTPIAMLLTAAIWVVCTTIITSHGIALTPLDVASFIVSLITAAAPIDFLPRSFTAR